MTYIGAGVVSGVPFLNFFRDWMVYKPPINAMNYDTKIELVKKLAIPGKNILTSEMAKNWLKASWDAQERRIHRAYLYGSSPLTKLTKEMSPISTGDPEFKMFFGMDPAITKVAQIIKHERKRKMSKKARIKELEREVCHLQRENGDLIQEMGRIERRVGETWSRLEYLERLPKRYHRIDLLQSTVGYRGRQIELLCEFLGVKFETQPAQPAQPSKLQVVKVKKS